MTALLFAQRYWKLIGLGLVCLLLAIQTVRLGHRTNQLEKERINSNELRAELKRISTAKNEQREKTKGNMKEAEEGDKEGKRIADKIREAPIPPDCKTPGLDILRNEI